MLAKPAKSGELQLLRLLLDLDGVFEKDDHVRVRTLRPHGTEVRADLRRGRRDFEWTGSDSRVVAPDLQAFEQRIRQRRHRLFVRSEAQQRARGLVQQPRLAAPSTTMIPVRIRWMIERFTRSRSATSAARDNDVISVRRSLADND